MKAVVQRCSRASVTIHEVVTSSIDRGIVVLLGVALGDTLDDVKLLADKIVNLRIFDDLQGKMNLSLKDVSGSVLIVSQFTLLADTRKGRRPSFVAAARPELGKALYEAFVQRTREQSLTVATGEFGADMQVSLVNDGPVTILLDSRENTKSPD